jgi:hypothetical protein
LPGISPAYIPFSLSQGYAQSIPDGVVIDLICFHSHRFEERSLPKYTTVLDSIMRQQGVQKMKPSMLKRSLLLPANTLK